jgi:hypothetical protein
MNEADINLAFSYYSNVYNTRMKIPWAELTEKEKESFLVKAKRRNIMAKIFKWLDWED